MWFGVYRGTTRVGQTLLDHLADARFITNLKNGDRVHLAARREHVGNPSTYVKGTWNQ